jgi:hypothetical protein
MESLKNPDTYMPDEAAVAVIERHIDDYNRERPGVRRRCISRTWMMLSGYAIMAALVIYLALQADKPGALVTLLSGFICIGALGVRRLAWKPIRDHRLALRHQLFPKVFGFISDVEYSAKQEPGFLRQFAELKIIDFSSTQSDDMVSGKHDGMRFELVETQLIRESGRSQRIVFKGVVFHFTLEKEFPGKLVAAKRGGWWERSIVESWRDAVPGELASGNRQLDEIYEFHSDNHLAARPVIAGPLTSVLTWLGNLWHGGDVQIAFSHKDGYLMMPTKGDYFALPELGDDISYERDVEPLVREIVGLLAVAHVARKIG